MLPFWDLTCRNECCESLGPCRSPRATEPMINDSITRLSAADLERARPKWQTRASYMATQTGRWKHVSKSQIAQLLTLFYFSYSAHDLLGNLDTSRSTCAWPVKPQSVRRLVLTSHPSPEARFSAKRYCSEIVAACCYSSAGG